MKRTRFDVVVHSRLPADVHDLAVRHAERRAMALGAYIRAAVAEQVYRDGQHAAQQTELGARELNR